jgi:hypothetical protein
MKIRLVLVAVGQPEFYTLAVTNPVDLVCLILHEHFAKVLAAKLLIMRRIKTKVQNINFIFESSKLYIAVGQMSNTVITYRVD